MGRVLSLVHVSRGREKEGPNMVEADLGPRKNVVAAAGLRKGQGDSHNANR